MPGARVTSPSRAGPGFNTAEGHRQPQPSPAVSMLWPRQRKPDHVAPYQWIDEASIGHMGLLGQISAQTQRDIAPGRSGSANLLQHAVDPPAVVSP